MINNNCTSLVIPYKTPFIVFSLLFPPYSSSDSPALPPLNPSMTSYNFYPFSSHVPIKTEFSGMSAEKYLGLAPTEMGLKSLSIDGGIAGSDSLSLLRRKAEEHVKFRTSPTLTDAEDKHKH